MKILTGSICLDDISKEGITTAKNGKKYINVSVVERSKVGNYGETHFISQYVKNAEKNPIIGNVKPLQKKPTGEGVKPADGLPF